MSVLSVIKALLSVRERLEHGVTHAHRHPRDQSAVRLWSWGMRLITCVSTQNAGFSSTGGKCLGHWAQYRQNENSVYTLYCIIAKFGFYFALIKDITATQLNVI